MPDTRKEQLLVNLRPHVVEVHLADRVITVGPMGSVAIGEPSPQVDELARRGLVALRDVDTEADGEAGDEAGTDESDAPGDDPSADDDAAADQPTARKARRTRGQAAAKRGEE